MFRILCQKWGGVTGDRSSYLKDKGVTWIFEDKAKADEMAAKLNREMNGPYATATYRYTVEEVL